MSMYTATIVWIVVNVCAYYLIEAVKLYREG